MTRAELIAEISGHVAQFWFPGMQVPTKYKEDLLDIIDYVDAAAAVRFGVDGEDDVQAQAIRQFSMSGSEQSGGERQFAIFAGEKDDYNNLVFGMFDNYATAGNSDIFMMALSPYNYTGYVLFDLIAAYDGDNRFELFASDESAIAGIYGHDNGDLVLRSTTQRILIQHGLAEYADDAAAAAGGIAVGEVYRTASVQKIRVA